MYLLGSFTSDMYLLGSLSHKETMILIRKISILWFFGTKQRYFALFHRSYSIK